MSGHWLTGLLRLPCLLKTGLILSLAVLTVFIFTLSPIKLLADAPNPLDQPVQHPLHFRYSGSNIGMKPDMVNSAISGYSPAQIRKAYGIDQLASTGAGKTIGIIVGYGSPTIQEDLQTFDQQFSLPSANLSIAYTGGMPSVNAGWAGETSLDVEWAHAIAPGANLLLVVAPTDDPLDLLTAVDYATTNGANIVSMSWDRPEFAGENNFDYHFNHPGVVYVDCSGDSGAGVNWPSVSPYVVSVGGTTLTLGSEGTYIGETGWSGSSGGVSAHDTKPGYQIGFQNYSFRTVPDVAFDADPITGVANYDSTPYQGQTGWFQTGGTSLSAPCWAALFALGNPNGVSWLYSQAASTIYSANYHDITSGSNGSYSAGTGYDPVTGLGSPVADNLFLGPAAKLAFTSSPSGAATGGAAAGAAFTIQPVVAVQDASGNTVTSSTAAVTLAITSGTGSQGAIISGHAAVNAVISGNTTVNAVNGVANFNGLKIDKAGVAYTLTATSGNFTAASSSFNVVHPGDANGDGSVTMADVTEVERVILGLDPPTPGCDANGDGIINMADVTKIERIILGLDPLIG
jgi:subtilase family serine protease